MKGYDIEVTATVRRWVHVKGEDVEDARYNAEERVREALDGSYEVVETESEVDYDGERECDSILFPY